MRRRSVPASRRWVFTAFLDLTLGVGNPILGLVAGYAGIQTVFAMDAMAAVLAVVLAVMLQRHGVRRQSARAIALS